MPRHCKYPPQEFNGISYYRKPSGYYVCNHRKEVRDRYIHRAKWRSAHGDIPKGCDIHHVDGNRSNNDIRNLQCMPRRDHHRLHSLQNHRNDPERTARALAAAREGAKQWHASPEGLAWHSKHGKQAWKARPQERRTCVKCGKPYATIRGCSKRGFCSPACQSAARRASGCDDETRSCAICGGKFSCNRYAKTSTCSKGCWRTLLSRTKRRVRPDG